MSRKVPHNALPPAALAEIHRRLVAGETRRTIARAVKCSKAAVDEYAKQHRETIEAERGDASAADEEDDHGDEDEDADVRRIRGKCLQALERLTDAVLDGRADAHTDKLLRAVKAALEALDRIHRLDRGLPTAHSKSERAPAPESKVVDPFAGAPAPVAPQLRMVEGS